MEKISSAQAALVLSQVPGVLRKQASEIEGLRAKVAFFEKRERCEKIAKALGEKGMNGELTFGEKVAHLMEQSGAELAATEMAVDLVAGNAVKLAHVGDVPGVGATKSGGRLTNFLLTREDPD